MIHALIGVFFFFVIVALPDDYAMQEAKMTILNWLQVLSHLPSSLHAEIDNLKEEVAALDKQQAESLASNEKANTTIHKLRAENLSLSKECDILTVEKAALMKKCLEVFNGTINANHDGEMALEALKNAIHKSNANEKQMLADSRILGDAMRVSPPPNEVEDCLAQRQSTQRSQQRRSSGNSFVFF
jgi:cell division protein FtsB